MSILDTTGKILPTIYKGFSTQAWVDGKKTLLVTNIDAIKADLHNHIYTEIGDRVHMLGFGTNIPSMPYEYNDEDTITIIENDLRQVFNYDPRVEILDISIFAIPDRNALLATADLYYIEFDVKDTLNIEFGANQQVF